MKVMPIMVEVTWIREAYCEVCGDIGGYESWRGKMTVLPKCKKCGQGRYDWIGKPIPAGCIFVWEEREAGKSRMGV
jgi:hypothetical protein